MGITKGQCLRIFDEITDAEIGRQIRVGKMIGDESKSYLHFTENTFAAVREFLVIILEKAEGENSG